jgi:hypothetical protein
MTGRDESLIQIEDDLRAALPALEQFAPSGDWVLQMLHEPGNYRPSRRVRFTGQPRRRRLAALVTVVPIAMATVLAAVGIIPLGGSSPVTPSASAAAFLHRAAAAAQARPAPLDDQFIYTEVVLTGWLGNGQVQRYQEWQSVNGSHPGVLRVNHCFPFGGDGEEQLHGQALTGPPTAGPCWMSVQATTRVTAAGTYAGLRTLPATPRALLAYILRHFQPGHLVPPAYPLTLADREWEGLFIILDNNVVVPPQLAAAIFRALADIPGVTLAHHAQNAAGQFGTGVTRTVDRVRSALIFDPHTYQLIGWQPGWVVPVDGGPSPQTSGIKSANAVLRTAVVARAPITKADIVFQPDTQRYFTR